MHGMNNNLYFNKNRQQTKEKKITDFIDAQKKISKKKNLFS